MGTNNLAAIGTGSPVVATGDQLDQYLTALGVDFLPRNASGVVTSGAGSLGSATYKWNNIVASGNLGIDGYADLNGQLRCWAYDSTGNTLYTSSLATVAFDAEVFDVGGFHDNVTNNSRFTIPVAGGYLIEAGTRWRANASGTAGHSLRVGGTTTIAYSTQIPVGDNFSSYISCIHNFTAGQYVELLTTEPSDVSGDGDRLALSGTGYTTYFKIVKIW